MVLRFEVRVETRGQARRAAAELRRRDNSIQQEGECGNEAMQARKAAEARYGGLCSHLGSLEL